jgi:hypothetical protein
MKISLGVMLISLLLSIPAHSAMVTKQGAGFDVTYDDSKLGLFGTLDLNGNNLLFTPNEFKAQSLNGNGLNIQSSTANDIRIIAKNDFTFGSILLQEYGDYFLMGESQVSVGGQLRVFDPANPFTTQTTSRIDVSSTTSLTINDGLTHDWVASAFIDKATPTVLGDAADWLASAGEIVLTIENIMTAFTQSGTGPQAAFIEKKFAGVGLTITSPVPEPNAWGSLSAGIFVLGVMVSRRKQHFYK